MRRIILFSLIAIISLNIGLFVFSYNIDDDNEYLTAHDFLEGVFIQNLIDELHNNETTPRTMGEYRSMNIGDPYRTINNDKIYLSIIVRCVYNEHYTPNGTDISGSENNGYSLRYVGICNSQNVSTVVNQLNSGEISVVDPFMDPIVVNDLRIVYDCDYFGGTLEEWNNGGRDDSEYYLRPATGAYNCHSYAWYSQSEQNNIWLHSPEMYFSENDKSYRSLNETNSPREGDIMVYIKDGSITHSAIIVGYTGDTSSDGRGNANKYIVVSKWSHAGLYRHNGNQGPYYKPNNSSFRVEYYRLNTNDQEVMSDSNDFNRNNIIIQAKSSTVSRDQTVYACEFDFAYSGNHNITITSDVALDTTLWNVWRENYGLTCNEVINEEGQYIYTYSGLFDAGYYYLRAECVNEDDIANISVSVSQHEHAYINYTDLGDGTHKLSCDCSVFSVENHEYECSDDENGTSHTYTCSCGISINEEHDYELVSKNSTHHTYACSCGSSFTNAHTYVKSNYSSTQHKMTCPCGNIKYEDHDYCTYTDYSSSNHKSSCDCGAYIYQLHVIKSDSGIGRYLPCTFCGRMIDTEDGDIKIPIIHNKFENEESE